MSLTLTYDAANARVVIEIGESPSSPASPPEVDAVTVERSVDELNWSTVRGAVSLDLLDGQLDTGLYDYEFVDGVENFYRVRDLEESPSESSPSPGWDVLFDDSITPDLDGQVWLKHPMFAFLNRPVTVTDWSDITRQSRSGRFEVSGRSWPVTVGDVRASREFTLTLLTDTPGDEQFMDLTLAAGGVLFMHIPAGCPVPGGYVDVGDTSEQRRSTRGPNRYFTLPCRIVAPPGPQIHGGTMTYAGLLNLDPDYEGLELSAATYAALLELVGTPNDLVTT